VGPSDRDVLRGLLADTIRLHQQVADGDLQPVLEAAATLARAVTSGGKVLLFGNGGSATDAQHVAAELVGRFERVRAPLAAVALTADPSVVTSVANDEGFDRVFTRQIEALGRAGDVAVGITTSGRSPNVVRALARARELGLRTVAVTGRDGGEAGRLADVHVNVATDSTARAQEVHRTLLHAMCALVERAAAGES
jgi:phosphoheptose isomerase